MKIGIVINSFKYRKHGDMLRILKKELASYGEIIVFDMSEKRPLHEYYWMIRDAGCSLLITLDCSGFELRTENDTLSYNNLGGRMVHILLHPIKEKYPELLKQQLNFSMFVYAVSSQEVELIKKSYPNIPNIDRFPRLDPDEKEAAEMLELKEWIHTMLEAAELLEVG